MGVCAFGGVLQPPYRGRRLALLQNRVFKSVIECPVDLQMELASSGVQEPCQGCCNHVMAVNGPPSNQMFSNEYN